MIQINNDEINLVGEFTYRLSRLERYAIDSGYLNKRGETPYPDYRSYYVAKINNQHISIPEGLSEIKKPIKKRRLKNDKIQWTEEPPPGDKLLDYIKQLVHVRNNLFHGSKSLDDKERDIGLIRDSIKILKTLASIDADGYGKFL